MTTEKFNYIAGDWLAGESTIENTNPSDISDVIGVYAQANVAQLESTLDCACSAQREWAHAGLERRHDVLMAIGNELIARSAELGELLSREEGNPR